MGLATLPASSYDALNVNKTSTAVQLRFDVGNSPNLPDRVRANLDRLVEMIREAAKPPPPVRRATKPTKGSQQRRMDSKSKWGEVKRLRTERPE